MNGVIIEIIDFFGSDESRKFIFDYSFWFYDGSKEESNGYYGFDFFYLNGKKFVD